ncbi:MAG: hypothetical protein LBF42_01290 [Puniceicoccales bacterium]|jgi:hypothetical protein|nr:hypothetical protein [Puniceicoccales bacterium]
MEVIRFERKEERNGMKSERRLNFTKKAVKNLPAPVNGYVLYHDTEEKGLNLCITAGGCKSFTFRKYIDGKGRYFVIERFPHIYSHLTPERHIE